MKIKIIIDVYTTRPDASGNRYSKCTLTNPRDGQRVNVDMGWGGGIDNAKHAARKLNLDWPEIHTSHAEGLTKKELDHVTCDHHEQYIDKAFRSIGLRKQAVKS